MPSLMSGKSDKAFSQNVRTEMEHGKPQKQALAIAYAMKRKSGGAAHGGVMCAHGKMMDECDLPHYADGGEAGDSGDDSGSGGDDSSSSGGGSSQQPLAHSAQAVGKFIKGFGSMAEGGFVEDEHQDPASEMMLGDFSEPGVSQEGYDAEHEHSTDKGAPGFNAEEKMRGYAEGGELEEIGDAPYNKEEMQSGYPSSLAYEVMKQMAMGGRMGYSEGGKVANDVGDPNLAGFEDNQYDDLVKSGGMSPSHAYPSNQEIGDAQEDSDRAKIIAMMAKAMRKKDRLPAA